MDLRAQASHYYELAARVLELFEEEEIVDVLCEVCGIPVFEMDIRGQRWDRMIGHEVERHMLSEGQTFKKRAAEIADHAHNPRGALGEGADFLRGLDEMERQCQKLRQADLWMV